MAVSNAQCPSTSEHEDIREICFSSFFPFPWLRMNSTRLVTFQTSLEGEWDVSYGPFSSFTLALKNKGSLCVMLMGCSKLCTIKCLVQKAWYFIHQPWNEQLLKFLDSIAFFPCVGMVRGPLGVMKVLTASWVTIPMLPYFWWLIVQYLSWLVMWAQQIPISCTDALLTCVAPWCYPEGRN